MSVIAVDVDNTILDITTRWWEWLESICSCKKPMFQYRHPLSYDFRIYFEEELKTVNRCAYDFFRQDGLYDLAKPYEKAVTVLRTLAEAGHEIVFVSAIKGRHSKSKYEFLKRNFPFMSGVVYTKEKQYVSCHVFIDDRASHVNLSKAPVKILFDAGQQQDEDVKNCKVVSDWSGVEKLLAPYFNIK